jgi:hypothetical protein
MVRDTIDEESLGEAEQNMLARFDDLMGDLFGRNPIKKIVSLGGQGLACALGSATGVSIATKGQESAQAIQLTLISAIADPVIDQVLSALNGKDIMRKYLHTCELLYLCEYFLPDKGIEA